MKIYEKRREYIRKHNVEPNIILMSYELKRSLREFMFSVGVFEDMDKLMDMVVARVESDVLEGGDFMITKGDDIVSVDMEDDLL